MQNRLERGRSGIREKAGTCDGGQVGPDRNLGAVEMESMGWILGLVWRVKHPPVQELGLRGGDRVG